MKKIVSILIIIVSILLYSCQEQSFEYGGEYLDLYTQAINNIPGAKGFIQSEKRFDPEIVVLDHDDYGRVLYQYYEGNNISRYSLLIMQYSNQQEVCYYSDKTFISSIDNVFNENDITQLKTDNDWNIEISENKQDCFPINSSKDQSPISYEQIKPLYEQIFTDDDIYSDDRMLNYFLSDDYGRVLIVAEARLSDKWVIMMFYPDGSYDRTKGFKIFTDYYTYQETLQSFLNDVGWNTPRT